ncbi:molybdenum cofactor biosynthesis protein MoaE [uncultured Campylobacter sp.]|uniref:molybdopterin synthase catalytic subunit n=1 Tax=uncultured Campylobacter sp. TaxID=218934 RepID=UPI0026269B17|nr:molybdenum cofactor biosynthesis protein MoaE [uncultured Campylobacter sp.]
MEIYSGALDVTKIYASWYERYKDKNCGAFITFAGIVRDEDGIDGLSFDIHKPLLKSWLDGWQERLKKIDGYALLAHSKGDVLIHECSYVAAIITPRRAAGLKLFAEFVEDFKQNAPIWKYDIIEKKRVYAKQRSHKLPNAGILSDD